jgi:hypothetical protein
LHPFVAEGLPGAPQQLVEKAHCRPLSAASSPAPVLRRLSGASLITRFRILWY